MKYANVFPAVCECGVGCGGCADVALGAGCVWCIGTGVGGVCRCGGGTGVDY